ALMDTLQIEEAIVGGLSMGGYVALAMFRQEAGRITGLVLADTRHSADTDDGRAGRMRLRAALAEHGPRAVADQMVPTLLSPAAPRALGAEVRGTSQGSDSRTVGP